MSIFEVWLAGYGAVFVLMTLVWLVSVVIKNASIVDIFWGFGFVVLAWTYFILTDGSEDRKILVVVLTTVWGLRLTLYLAWRNIGKGEDYRYQNFRQRYGKDSYWWKSFFQTYMLQGLVMVIVVTPILVAQYSTTPVGLTLFDMGGSLVWLLGFGFETIGDLQLARFKSDPANEGKVLRTGLWRYTRHPNYFGNATMWWGYFIIALGTPLGFLSFFGPLFMTFLLLRVSGVALLEKSLQDTKPEYEDYIGCTSAFLPMPPKC